MEKLLKQMAKIKVHKMGHEQKIEQAEDNTLLGRLATRIASRDYIDRQNLGFGTAAKKASTANIFSEKEKVETAKFKDSVPRKMNMTNSVKEGSKVEMEHKDTIKKHAKSGADIKEVTKSIAKDHLKEDPDYYKKMNALHL